MWQLKVIATFVPFLPLFSIIFTHVELVFILTMHETLDVYQPTINQSINSELCLNQSFSESTIASRINRCVFYTGLINKDYLHRREKGGVMVVIV